MRPMSQVETTDTPDNLLKVYAYFRACLSATLLIMYLIDMGLNVLGNTYPQIYLGTTSAYSAISLLTLIHFHFNQSGPSIQLLFFMLLTDIVATTIIIHSSGGLSRGLGFSAANNVPSEEGHYLVSAEACDVGINVCVNIATDAQGSQDTGTPAEDDLELNSQGTKAGKWPND